MMKHQNSKDLLSYWEKLRGTATAPDRMAVEPRAMANILPYVFILDVSGPAAVFRLAGTAVCSAHMGELKGRHMASLWEQGDRGQIETLALSVSKEGAGAVVGSKADNGKETIAFETLLLPLLHKGRNEGRLIGVQSALGQHWSLGSFPTGPHRLSSLRMLTEGRSIPGALQRAGLTDGGEIHVLDFSRRERHLGRQGRRVGHLTVIEGGAAAG